MSPARLPHRRGTRQPSLPTSHRSPGSAWPIITATDALALFVAAARTPLHHEVLAFALDQRGHASDILCVVDTYRPDAVVEVVEVMADAVRRAGRGHKGIVVCSSRPCSGLLAGDVDRWCDASAAAESFDCELVEWFVLSPFGVEQPRQLLGEPDRW